MNPIRQALISLPGNWTKGPVDDQGNTCGLGHLYTFGMVDSVDFSEYRNARDLMTEVANAEFPERVPDIGNVNGYSYMAFASFNDHPDTTEAEVIAVMEKAAIKYDEIYGE